MFRYVTRSGVGVIAWRQGGGSTAEQTLRPRDNHRTVVSRGRAVRVLAGFTAAAAPSHDGTGALVTAGAAISGSAVRAVPGAGIYPDAADVRAGVLYGPTGTEYTGTMSILLDLNTGRLVKIIGQKVALLL